MLIRAAEAFGWLVLPLVFKTNVGREERPGGVRFPYVSAISLSGIFIELHFSLLALGSSKLRAQYKRSHNRRCTTHKPYRHPRNSSI